MFMVPSFEDQNTWSRCDYYARIFNVTELEFFVYDFRAETFCHNSLSDVLEI